MIVFDTRMVQGYPLQYYSPPFPLQYHHNHLKYDYYSMTEISEEVMMPSSPHSVQSDSDNSMSSIDVSSSAPTIYQKPRLAAMSPLKTTSTTTTEVSDVKCGWHQCGLWFESLDMLANHVSKAHASSGANGLFYCGWEGCSRNNKGFNARYKMLVHVRTHTNQKPHQCCQCEKSFSRAENLKIHSRSHSGEKPYVCPVPGCNKAYSNSSDRFKHTRTHQVEKPYLCKVPGCNKRYTDPSSLRKHVKTYKHFGGNDAKTQQTTPATTTETTKLENNNSNVVNNHECSSPPHSCCLKTCLTKAAELLKLGAFINFRETNIEDVTWNKLIEQQSNNIYNNYSEHIQMDVDVPLDLTVHRK